MNSTLTMDLRAKAEALRKNSYTPAISSPGPQLGWIRIVQFTPPFVSEPLWRRSHKI